MTRGTRGTPGRLRVLTLVGTRPELIKMSRVVAELQRVTDHYLVHSGQNYAPELSQAIFDDLELRKPDRWLDAARPKSVDTIAATLSAFDNVLEELTPDAVVIYGDTDTGLAGMAAKRRQIPIFHLEAGNRCFDQRVPEEINRKIIDHFSDINLVLSENARRLLLAEGFPADRLFKIGSPMKEVLSYHRAKIDASDILSRIGLAAQAYVIASVHRAENIDEPRTLERILDTLIAVAEHFAVKVVVSTHPRMRKRLEAFGCGARASKHLEFLPAFPFSDYIKLQMSGLCVLSDSGSLTEETSILDLPAVALRQQHERLEGMDEGTVILGGIDRDRVIQAMQLALDHRRGGRMNRLVADYDVDDVSRHVVRLIVSYVDYVRRVVWKCQ